MTREEMRNGVLGTLEILLKLASAWDLHESGTGHLFLEKDERNTALSLRDAASLELRYLVEEYENAVCDWADRLDARRASPGNGGTQP